MSDPIDVTITGLYECGLTLCSNIHYSWDCPVCGNWHEHYETSEFPVDEKCGCGTINRITKAEADRWERDGYGPPR